MKLFKNNLKNISFFTINCFDNNYYINNHRTNEFEDRIIQYYRKNYLNFQIVDYTHPLVKKCKEKFKEYFDKCLSIGYINGITDIIRLYILSKIPYSLYIDNDVLVNPTYILNLNNYYISHIFSYLYNGEKSNLTIFKNLLDYCIKRNTEIFNTTSDKYNHLQYIDSAIMKDYVKETNFKANNDNNCFIHYQDNVIKELISNSTTISTIVNINSDLYNVHISEKCNGNNFAKECFDIPFLIKYFNIKEYNYLLKNKLIQIFK